MINVIDIDPVIIRLYGPFAISWYSLAYVIGIMFCWFYTKYLNQHLKFGLTNNYIDDLVTWSVIGILIGGRLGYVIFYNLTYYTANPLEIFMTWHGGMSFHGALIGLILSIFIATIIHRQDFFKIMDLVACSCPVGLFLGRIANFINGELYGRVTDVSWAIIFPNGGNVPRHPSQLYEALTEGLIIFVIQFLLVKYSNITRYRGLLSSSFLIQYALYRFTIEFFREPDPQIGLLWQGLTMGQILSSLMIITAIIITATTKRRI